MKEQELSGEETTHQALEKARVMVERAFGDDEWVDELLNKQCNPQEFLEMIARDPRCEIIRMLAFDTQEGDTVLVGDSGGDLRPVGEVKVIDRKKYVGGWMVDNLGFYASPTATHLSPEVFNRLKVTWINQNIFGARSFGEKQEEYEARKKELAQRIEEYKRKLENKDY